MCVDRRFVLRCIRAYCRIEKKCIGTEIHNVFNVDRNIIYRYIIFMLSENDFQTAVIFLVVRQMHIHRWVLLINITQNTKHPPNAIHFVLLIFKQIKQLGQMAIAFNGLLAFLGCSVLVSLLKILLKHFVVDYLLMSIVTLLRHK